MFNDSVYKQIHGCAMGSPVNPVVAYLYMEVIEESAIAASTTPPKVWKRYVDDSFVIIKEHSVNKFHYTLNAVDSKISFTIETDNNGQISFLDTLITRKNGSVTIGVYRKSTHTDRYLDFNSHHELKHKISTASTLLNRALNLPSTAEGVRKELTHVSNALKSNGYIYIFTSAFYTSLFKDCRLAIESSVFLKLLTRERPFLIFQLCPLVTHR